MKKADSIKHKKWLKDRRRSKKLKRQHNYETKTLKRWQFAPPEEVKQEAVKK